MISFYCIARLTRFAFKPWINWIASAGEAKVSGARVGWLWFDLEINYYDRNSHLRLIINEYKNRNDDFLQNELRSKDLETHR